MLQSHFYTAGLAVYIALNSMAPLIAATEFEICVSMGDLVTWPDESAETPAPNPRPQAIFEALGAKIDLLPLHHDYFHDYARTGRGNVHVYELNGDPVTVVAIDLYNEPTDQMDLIRLYIRCSQSASEQVAALVSNFFCNASTQVAASQQCISTKLRNVVDKGRFPLRIADSWFSQVQIHHNAA